MDLLKVVLLCLFADAGRQAAMQVIVEAGFEFSFVDVFLRQTEVTCAHKVIPLDEIVREGRVITVNKKVYERSQRLRSAAISAAR